MILTLQDIVDLDDLNALMHFFYEAAGIPVGVLDLNHHWLVLIGRQKICVDYHQTHQACQVNCLLSGVGVLDLLDGKDHIVYSCPNGLVEVVMPILLNDKILGYFILGQFLHAPVDREFFRRQAIAYGFNIDSYLDALDSVPVVSTERIDHLMGVFTRFFRLLTRLGAENQQRCSAEQETRQAKEKLESKVEERTRELNNALIEVSDLAAQLNETLLEVEDLAVTDRLTETYNRRKFDEMVVYEHKRAKYGQIPFSLIMLDIDHFKRVNDQHGHSVGDDILRQLVRLIKTLIRQNDFLIRWGGEEFLILLPTTEASEAGAFAERIRRKVEAESFAGIDSLTISLGVAQVKENDSTDELLKRVDLALYRAKREGRNRVVVATI